MSDTMTIFIPRRGGGSDAIPLRMPRRIQRYALAQLYAEARGDTDREVEEVANGYLMNIAFYATIGLCWQGATPLKGLPRHPAADLVAFGEAVYDSLYELGFDPMDAVFFENVGEAVSWVLSSLSEADEAAQEAAQAVFGDEEGDASDATPSSVS